MTNINIGEAMDLRAFIGRQDEVGLLAGLLEKKTASIAVVRGRRRIGKTRLIEEFSRDYRFYSFEGLVPDEGITAQHQRDHFSLLLSQQTKLPEVFVDDFPYIP